VYFVGYARVPPRGEPAEFTQILLGGETGLKRLMPGRALGLGSSFLPGSPMKLADGARRIVTSDISSGDGTAGGPLVEMSSGKLIGMHYGGIWKGERGKFAYAELLSEPVLKAISGSSSAAPAAAAASTPPGK
jgi:hypothetical protein